MRYKLGDRVWACYYFIETNFKMEFSTKKWSYENMLYSRKVTFNIDSTVLDDGSSFIENNSLCNFGDPVYD